MKADLDQQGSALKSERQNWGEERLVSGKDWVTESLTEEPGFILKAMRSLEGIYVTAE